MIQAKYRIKSAKVKKKHNCDTTAVDIYTTYVKILRQSEK